MADAPKLDDLDYRLARLDLKPGDVLVLKVHLPLSKDLADKWREALEKKVPGQPVLVVDKHADLAVIHRELVA